jgi:ribosome silencing factor RsfS/YbeB/iojap
MPTKKKASPTKKTATTKVAKKAVAKKVASKAAAKKVAKKATKKTAAKKVVKKAAKKTAAKKVAKKATKKTAAKKVAKKATTKKTAAKKVAKKATKTAAKKPAAKKVAKKATKKPAAKKTAAKKTAAKKVAKKATTTKTAAKKTAAKKATTKTAKAASPSKVKLSPEAMSYLATASDVGHGAIALPPKKKPLNLDGYLAPASARAAVTVVPADSGDDVDDALDDAMGDAFDAVFVAPTKKATKPAAPFVPGDASLDLAQVCAALALEKKADDVVILQVAELTSYADQFVIAAAASERQAQAVARNIVDELRRRGKQPLSTDGLEQGNWVIVDYGPVVVHIFMQSARAYYDLDGFWIDAPRIAVDESRGKAALEHLG